MLSIYNANLIGTLSEKERVREIEKGTSLSREKIAKINAKDFNLLHSIRFNHKIYITIFWFGFASVLYTFKI